MEDILLHLPQVFSYLTGMVIAFGVVTSIELHKVMICARKRSGEARNTDLALFVVFTTTTIFLLGALFLFPTFTSQHMNLLVILEFWYASFLLCTHSQYSKICAMFAESVILPSRTR